MCTPTRTRSEEHHSLPGTPEWMAPLSRELEEVIAQRNLLTCRTRKRVLNDLSDAACKSDDEHMESLRRRAVSELVSSEKSYLRHLEIVQQFFMRPIEEKKLLPQVDFATIFGDLKSILQVNRELLAALEECNDQIGKVFLELAPYLKFYSTYANDFETSVKLVEKWTVKSKPFRLLLSNQETRPEVQLKLNSLLITPIQRIPRYKLLLEDLIKNTPESHPDKVNLRDALQQIDAVAWHINEQLREHDNGLKMINIQRSLVGGFPKIVAPGRRLIMQGILMKVPRAGGCSGLPRYFVLFNDMLMYCKIKTGSDVALPKKNSLECGCLMPLKHAKVETLVGKGVFKVSCQKEELILYSCDGGRTSEEWVDSIEKAICQHKKDAATLRKESSRREPLKRPDIMKMRRESLSQIMMLRKRMTLRDRSQMTPPAEINSPYLFSPKSSKKRSTLMPEAMLATPMKVFKNKDSEMQEASSPVRTPARETMPPPASSSVNVELRNKMGKKIRRPSSWRTMTLSRKDRLRSEARSKSSLFRSPSIYDDQSSSDKQNDDGNDVMASYLAEKICPLTPSQKPTNISHLVQQSERQPTAAAAAAADATASTAREQYSLPPAAAPIQGELVPSYVGSYCSLM